MARKAITILAAVFLLVSTIHVFAGTNPSVRPDEQIIQVESMTFFQDLPGTFHVYFGNPASPECIEFEKHLKNFLQESTWTVYYCDTVNSKDDAQYENVLKKYKISTVPMLVTIKDSEFCAAFEWEPSANEAEVQKELRDFFGTEAVKGFPVTTVNNFPIQFDANLHTFTFLIMGLTILYLLIAKKEIIQKQLTSVLILFALSSTLLFALHLAIAGFGMNFAIHYNAAPDARIWARIGTLTWLTVTPLLYFGILALCISIRCKIKKSRA